MRKTLGQFQLESKTNAFVMWQGLSDKQQNIHLSSVSMGVRREKENGSEMKA